MSSLDTFINVRMRKADVEKFDERCAEIDKPRYQVLRELIEAFNDNRLSIKPTDQQKKSMEMYK